MHDRLDAVGQFGLEAQRPTEQDRERSAKRLHHFAQSKRGAAVRSSEPRIGASSDLSDMFGRSDGPHNDPGAAVVFWTFPRFFSCTACRSEVTSAGFKSGSSCGGDKGSTRL